MVCCHRLNATDINMPQWKFSKIIHSAKIKFTDHSILRIVQILGALGNWKRVLQVVEWLQSHVRFESYKSRSGLQNYPSYDSFNGH